MQRAAAELGKAAIALVEGIGLHHDGHAAEAKTQASAYAR